MGTFNDKHPCNMCDKDCLNVDCVWYNFIRDEYCNNYYCKFEYEGICKLGFASRCAMSTEFEKEEKSIDWSEEDDDK